MKKGNKSVLLLTVNFIILFRLPIYKKCEKRLFENITTEQQLTKIKTVFLNIYLQHAGGGNKIHPLFIFIRGLSKERRGRWFCWERVRMSKIRTSKVQKEHRKSKKFEKDQNVKIQIRLLTFLSFLTP